MRVVSWNMNKRKESNWEWILKNSEPDYVLAQEASPLPSNIKASVRTTTKKSNRTVFYSKDQNHKRIKMTNDNGMGLIVTNAKDLFFICVYANLDFKPVDPPLLGLLATYVANIRRKHSAKNILIAGDFNMDRRMDDNPTGSKFANKGTTPTNDFFDALLDMGFYDCMRKFQSNPIQTHRNARSKFPWELDHMFATEDLYNSLTDINTVEVQELSDHDPIIANFNIK